MPPIISSIAVGPELEEEWKNPTLGDSKAESALITCSSRPIEDNQKSSNFHHKSKDQVIDEIPHEARLPEEPREKDPEPSEDVDCPKTTGDDHNYAEDAAGILQEGISDQVYEYRPTVASRMVCSTCWEKIKTEFGDDEDATSESSNSDSSEESDTESGECSTSDEDDIDTTPATADVATSTATDKKRVPVPVDPSAKRYRLKEDNKLMANIESRRRENLANKMYEEAVGALAKSYYAAVKAMAAAEDALVAACDGDGGEPESYASDEEGDIMEGTLESGATVEDAELHVEATDDLVLEIGRLLKSVGFPLEEDTQLRPWQY